MKKYKQKIRGKITPNIEQLKNAEIRLAEAKKDFLSFFPQEHREYIDKHTYFAGGCIYSLYNNKEPTDYDIFCDSKECVEFFSTRMKDRTDTVVFVTDSAISLDGFKYQIIKKWYGEPYKVVGEFDFYHNHFAFINGKIISFHNWRYITIKKLCFNFKRGRDIANVLLRIPKFIERGFYIYKSEHLKIIKKALENSTRELESIKNTREGY